MPRRKPLAVMRKYFQPPGRSSQETAVTRRTVVFTSLPLALEPGKIMFPLDKTGGPAHPVQIQGRPQMPAALEVQGGAHPPVQEAVLVGLGLGAIAGVEIFGGLCGLQNDDVPGEETVQALPKGGQRQSRPGPEMRHLPQGMHPGISPARAVQANFPADEPGQAGFHNFLNRQGIALPLPAVIAGAVVFQGQANGPQLFYEGGWINGDGFLGGCSYFLRIITVLRCIMARTEVCHCRKKIFLIIPSALEGRGSG